MSQKTWFIHCITVSLHLYELPPFFRLKYVCKNRLFVIYVFGTFKIFKFYFCLLIKIQ